MIVVKSKPNKSVKSAAKNQPTKLIKSIVVGAKDPAKNTVVNVLARSNEYVIYEIEDKDLNNKMKVLVDGLSEDSENIIGTRFNKVKQKYIEAKGLLGKAKNDGMMKQRIAHTLSTCLSTDDVDGVEEFSALITTITKEHEEVVSNRAIYLAPCVIATLVLFSACVFFMDQRTVATPLWLILTSLLASSLGGSISILAKAKLINFQEFRTSNHYFLAGVERIFLAYVAGAIVFVAIKSGVLFPLFIGTNYWGMMMIVVVSGFSESFVPGILDKIDKENS